MAERRPVTRKTLKRELALNAATKPVAIAVPAAVAVAAFVLGAPQVRELRRRVSAVAEGMDEAADELRVRPR